MHRPEVVQLHPGLIQGNTMAFYIMNDEGEFFRFYSPTGGPVFTPSLRKARRFSNLAKAESYHSTMDQNSIFIIDVLGRPKP